MLATASDRNLRVERGPSCLLVRLDCRIAHAPDEPPLAEALWSLMERHFTYRLVLELDETDCLAADLVEQLAWLARRLLARHGMLYLCGLTPSNREALRRGGLDSRFLAYDNREEAIFAGRRPCRPR